MRAPKKVIAAMALATMIGGTGAITAHADYVSEFKTNAAVAGQDPLQTGEKTVTSDDTSTVQGDIEVNGSFTKRVTNFPVPAETGDYLRVTMPISLNYTYNLDDNVLKSAKGTVTNESEYVQKSPEGNVEQREGRSVSMTFVKLDNATGNPDMKYVQSITEADKDKVQLPFQVVVSKEGKDFKEIPLSSIVEQNKDANTIFLKPNTDVQLEIRKIGALNLEDKENKLNGQTSASIGNKMIMKFEYVKQS